MNNKNFVIIKDVLVKYNGNDENVTIPDGITKIGEGAFYQCDNITSVNIPDSVTKIEEGAFAYCHHLLSVNIPDSVTSIGDNAFILCFRLENLVIPDSVTQIGNNAFYGCAALVNKDGFIVVRDVLYNYYGKGTHITVPDGVKELQGDPTIEAVFCKLKTIESITLPASLTKLDPNDFYYLKNLRWIECKGEVSVSKNANVFPGCKKMIYLICNPDTPLSKMPDKWKRLLAIGVTKYLYDGNEVRQEALKEVVKYIKSQNVKLQLYKLGYEYPFVAEFMVKYNILTVELYDEMIAYTQEHRIIDILALLIEGKAKLLNK